MKSNHKGFLLALCVLLFARCIYQQEMADQPRYDPLEASDFFSNGMSARPLVSGTVAQGTLPSDPVLATGKSPDGALIARSPIPPSQDVVRLGEERFRIYCVVCHGENAEGDGPAAKRGFLPPPSLHDDRLKTAPDGHIFDVIANGYGVMPSYGHLVPTEHRWAIVAYVRKLQGQIENGNSKE